LTVLTLYLTRHGQTAFSRENRFCGELDPPLTDVGRQMADALAAGYASLPWAAIYTSHLQRTIETARPLAERAGIPIRQERDLREISYGEWEGQSQEEMAARFPEKFHWWAEDPASRGTPGGETAFQVAARAVPVLDRIREAHRDGNVLVVTHKATARILICALLNLDVRLYRDRIAQAVATMTAFDFKPRGPMLRMLGERSHLPLTLRDVEGT